MWKATDLLLLVTWATGHGCLEGCGGPLGSEAESSVREGQGGSSRKVKGKGKGSLPGENQENSVRLLGGGSKEKVDNFSHAGRGKTGAIVFS